MEVAPTEREVGTLGPWLVVLVGQAQVWFAGGNEAQGSGF